LMRASPSIDALSRILRPESLPPPQSLHHKRIKTKSNSLCPRPASKTLFPKTVSPYHTHTSRNVGRLCRLVWTIWDEDEVALLLSLVF